MFCPECETEYRDGIERCSDCDVRLVENLYEDRPSAALIPLVSDASSEFVGELLDKLEKAAVPYVIEAGTALSMLDNEEQVVGEPEPWNARIWIVESFTDRARRILHELDLRFPHRRAAPSDPD